MERSDEATCSRVIKLLETVVVGSQSDAFDAFLHDLISTDRDNSRDQWSRLRRSDEPNLATCAHRFK